MCRFHCLILYIYIHCLEHKGRFRLFLLGIKAARRLEDCFQNIKKIAVILHRKGFSISLEKQYVFVAL